MKFFVFQNVLDQRQNLSLHFAITLSFYPKPEILKQFRISFPNFTVIIKSILKFVLKPNHEKNLAPFFSKWCLWKFKWFWKVGEISNEHNRIKSIKWFQISRGFKSHCFQNRSTWEIVISKKYIGKKKPIMYLNINPYSRVLNRSFVSLQLEVFWETAM